MSPQLACRVAFDRQITRLRQQLSSPSLSPWALVNDRPVPSLVRPRTVTPYGMNQRDRQTIYRARYAAKRKAVRAEMQARRRTAT